MKGFKLTCTVPPPKRPPWWQPLARREFDRKLAEVDAMLGDIFRPLEDEALLAYGERNGAEAELRLRGELPRRGAR